MASGALIKRASRGEPAAFEELLGLYEKRVYQLCLRVSGNRDDALDLAQESLLRVYRHIGSFRGQSQFSTWVYRITLNVCMDEMRRRKARAALSVEALADQGVMPEASEEGPESHVLGKETAASIGQCLQALPDDQRVAVVMRDVQGMAYEEIAAVLDINLNTLKSRIARGRRALQQLLTERGATFAGRGRLTGKCRGQDGAGRKGPFTVVPGANCAEL